MPHRLPPQPQSVNCRELTPLPIPLLETAAGSPSCPNEIVEALCKAGEQAAPPTTTMPYRSNDSGITPVDVKSEDGSLVITSLTDRKTPHPAIAGMRVVFSPDIPAMPDAKECATAIRAILRFPPPDEVISALMSRTDGDAGGQRNLIQKAMSDRDYSNLLLCAVVDSPNRDKFFLACRNTTGPVHESIIAFLKKRSTFLEDFRRSGQSGLWFFHIVGGAPVILGFILVKMAASSGTGDRDFWTVFSVGLGIMAFGFLLLWFGQRDRLWAKRQWRAYTIGNN